MNVSRAITSAVLWICAWWLLAAVEAYGQTAMQADAYVVPHSGTDSSTIVVFVRIPHTLLTFVRVTDPNEVGGNFKSDVVVSAELRDSIGVIRQRERWDQVVYATSYEETTSPDRYTIGWLMFRVHRGTYAVNLETLSRRSKEIVLDSLVAVHAADQARGMISRPLFVQAIARDGREVLRPYVMNGDIGFSAQDARALILLASRTDEEFDYIIRPLPYGPQEIQWWDNESIEGRAMASTTRVPRLSDDASSDEALLEIRRRDTSAIQPSTALLEIPIPVSVLVPGNYELALVRRSSWTADTLRVGFRIIWERMPQSLRSIDRALRLMHHILSDEQLDSLEATSDVQRRRLLMDWWRRNDPTPTSTYNERMAVYFTRADEADRRYSTIQESVGSLSERGRVFMLYGPPTTISTLLPVNDEPRETWIYTNDVNKEITFGIDRQGIYRIRDVFDRSLLPAGE
jgi:GWxTD domain-containing protein